MGRLSDPKPEVRSIAMATLAGMIKGMSGVEADVLREEALAKAKALLAPPRAAAGIKRAVAAVEAPALPKGAEAPGAAADAMALLLLQKHSAVLVSVDRCSPFSPPINFKCNPSAGPQGLPYVHPL